MGKLAPKFSSPTSKRGAKSTHLETVRRREIRQNKFGFHAQRDRVIVKYRQRKHRSLQQLYQLQSWKSSSSDMQQRQIDETIKRIEMERDKELEKIEDEWSKLIEKNKLEVDNWDPEYEENTENDEKNEENENAMKDDDDDDDEIANDKEDEDGDDDCESGSGDSEEEFVDWEHPDAPKDESFINGEEAVVQDLANSWRRCWEQMVPLFNLYEEIGREDANR
jgi:hypothetical protein